MNNVLVDTNVLIHHPRVFKDFQEQLVIHMSVIEELDRLKDCNNPDLAHKSRHALQLILKNKTTISFASDNWRAYDETDDILLDLAERESYLLLTNDLPIILKADIKGLKYQNYYGSDEVYTGVRYFDIPCDSNGYSVELENVLQKKQFTERMHENEFLIVRDTNSIITNRDGTITPDVVCMMQYHNGELRLPPTDVAIHNAFISKITPRNIEQNCLFNLLQDKNVTILSANGTFGTGKSFVLINYALQQVEKGKKIVYVPNNSFSKDSREIAAVPGGIIEKELMHMGTLTDIIGIDIMNHMIEEGSLEVTPISIMRGRDIKDAIIYVNEAQNLTEDHVQLLIGRCGEGTRIFFDGDIKQTDSIKFRNRSGLRQLTELRNSSTFSPLFGCVKLKVVERSKTAMASAYLNELDFF